MENTLNLLLAFGVEKEPDEETEGMDPKKQIPAQKPPKKAEVPENGGLPPPGSRTEPSKGEPEKTPTHEE